jgi:hypothetical protein
MQNQRQKVVVVGLFRVYLGLHWEIELLSIEKSLQ